MDHQKIVALSNLYLNRYAWPRHELRNKFVGNPDIIVVVPAHNEPNLAHSLAVLHNCTPPKGEVLIIVLINESVASSEEVLDNNINSFHKATVLNKVYKQQVLHLQLPPKKAGVGLARKIGMDEAVRIFEAQNKNGIIVCYDADCHCEPNYLIAIEDFYRHVNANLGLVHYEHKLHQVHHEAIVNYELYLRYYINALRVASYPFAVQTLGSCITVRSFAYQKQGGMNQRKAGEDFYFIHKVMPLGDIGEINQTTIYPSDRLSDRVPFGTGHAVGKYLSAPNPDYPVYDYRIFEDLKFINEGVESLYHQKDLSKSIPESIASFYSENSFSLDELIKQSGSATNFRDRYYQWWDGFQVLKFVHFARDNYYPQIPLSSALDWLDDQENGLRFKGKSREEQLLELRTFDKAQNFYIK
ncbi:MAG: glycosyltransferase family A protein [Cyclobacteriaceae bacterium]